MRSRQRLPDAPEPVPPSPGGFMYGFSTTNAAIAGATLMPLDDDWRATLGVDNGVLVTKVLARNAVEGLRAARRRRHRLGRRPDRGIGARALAHREQRDRATR